MLSEVVLRRRSGWFFQSDLAAQHRISAGLYDIEIAPIFLHRVLNIALSRREWLEALREALPDIAPHLQLQPDGPTSTPSDGGMDSQTGLAGMDMDSMDCVFSKF